MHLTRRILNRGGPPWSRSTCPDQSQRHQGTVCRAVWEVAWSSRPALYCGCPCPWAVEDPCQAVSTLGARTSRMRASAMACTA